MGISWSVSVIAQNRTGYCLILSESDKLITDKCHIYGELTLVRSTIKDTILIV